MIQRAVSAAVMREEKKEIEVITADPWAAIDDQTCTICCADIKEGDKIYKLACEHTFHKACIDPWLEKSSECPNCRGDVYRKPDPKPETREAATRRILNELRQQRQQNNPCEMVHIHPLICRL